MPVFIAAIGGMLINIVGTLAGRVLVALGVGVVTYTGLNTTLDFLKVQALGSFTGLPADVIGLISFLNVGVCINVIFSAMVARSLISGISGDSFKRWVLK